MKINLSLKKSWTILILISVIVPAILLMLWFGHQLYSTQLKNALLIEQQANEALRDQIESELKRLKAVIHNKVDPLIPLVDKIDTPNTLKKINRYLDFILERELAVREIMILSKEAKVIAAIDPNIKITSEKALSVEQLQVLKAHWGIENSNEPPELVIPLFGRDYISSPQSHDDFIAFTDATDLSFKKYSGSGFQRTLIGYDPTVMNVNSEGDYGGSNLHGEQYYLANPADIIFFYCKQAAESGGDTLICKGDELLAKLPEEVREKFIEQKISYIRILSKPTFDDMRADNPAALNKWTFEEISDDRVRTKFQTVATRQAPNGNQSYINSILPMLFDFDGADQEFQIQFEDGTIIDKELGHVILEAAEAVQEKLKLESGQAIAVDNRWVLHGRTPFQGQRSMLSRMA